MNEIINIERLSQLLGIDALRKDVEKLQQQFPNVNSQSAVDVEKLRKQIDGLQQQVKQLNNDKAQLNSEIAQLNTEKAKLNAEKIQLNTDKIQLNTEKAQLKLENDNLLEEKKKLFSENERIKKEYDLHALYEQLDDDSKDQISPFFPYNANNKAMIFKSLQEKNIKNFYNVVRNKVNNKINDPKIKTLLRWVFDFYANSGEIKLIEPNVGDLFDTDEHTSKSGNQSAGSPITEVLLFGFRDKEGKVVNTALVKA